MAAIPRLVVAEEVSVEPSLNSIPSALRDNLPPIVASSTTAKSSPTIKSVPMFALSVTNNPPAVLIDANPPLAVESAVFVVLILPLEVIYPTSVISPDVLTSKLSLAAFNAPLIVVVSVVAFPKVVLPLTKKSPPTLSDLAIPTPPATIIAPVVIEVVSVVFSTSN